MPTYRSITLQLHSQFDVDTFPEYLPKPQEYYTARGVLTQAPAHVDEKRSACSVYIAVFPGSTFWLSYSVAPPIPEDQHFLFKLFINGNHIVSWSTGKAEEWKGKTMFGLYARDEGQDGKKKIEKRALRFTAPDSDGSWRDVTNAFDHEANIEVRVHRASGRKRIGCETEQYAKTPHGAKPRGIDLVNAGRAGGDHPKRFYKFALIDPTDQPFVTFRYYYRTWEQIRYLGLIDGDSDAADMSVIEPCDDDVLESPQKKVEKGETSAHPRTYIPTGAQSTETHSDECSDWQRSQRHSGVITPPQFYRLSVPPAFKLDPPQLSSKPLPSIPQESDSFSSTAYRPHPAYPVEEWMASTPSPVKSIRNLISTPPLLGRKKAFAPSSLVNAVTTAWKKRGMPSSEFSSRTESRNSSRADGGSTNA